MNALLKFELGFYFKRPGIYIALLLLFTIGFLIGFQQLSFNGSNYIHKNAPYSIANMVGFLSLAGVLIPTLIAALTLFREAEASFSLILYATPLTKMQYLYSRFTNVFCMSLACLIFIIGGYAIGQLTTPDQIGYGPFHLWSYLQPVLLLLVPNVFFCCSLICSIAWLSKNKLMVYLSGLFLYIVYMVLLVYSGSPLMAGALPQSPEVIGFAARIDPFGLSAFYQQTNTWNLQQKNLQFISFTGNLLVNRAIYITLGFLLLLWAWKIFRFMLPGKQSKTKGVPLTVETVGQAYQSADTTVTGIRYQFQVIQSLIRLDINFAIKSIPFVLVSVAIIFFMAMEFYGTIDQGIRLPEHYATTAVMANRIIYNLPGLLVIVILFYGHELYWRSADSAFMLLERCTPATLELRFAAKWISLVLLVFILLTIVIATGIVFQFCYEYIKIDWLVYVDLYWLIGGPLLICAGITLLLQVLINQKWIGLLTSCVVLFLLATAIGKSIGITHPLVRFAAAYTAKYSEMNGWGPYFSAFSWKMLYGICTTLLATALIVHFKEGKRKKLPLIVAFLLILCLASGIYIQQHLPRLGEDEKLKISEVYEKQYRQYYNDPQPTVSKIKADVELFPDKNAYHVNALYKLINQTGKPIKRLLVNFDDDLTVEKAFFFSNKGKVKFKQKVGFLDLKTPLLPGDTAIFSFSFSYHWDGFTGHRSFNAIVKNGTFIRISNYFPRFGYQPDLEIIDLAERRSRKLGNPTPLVKLAAQRTKENDFIGIDMTVGTDAGQTVIGVGELTGKWKLKDRSYFRYQTKSPIPFRFGLSSANYQLKRVKHTGVDIEVYFTKDHEENVQHLIQNAARTLDYCQSNFSAYPYRTIRFAEVSQFTEGFAGTAYPATIFMTEQMIFHVNQKGDKKQDVINELAGHELSHQWWGAGQFVPDEREGAKLLTETIAMYVEMMLVKHSIGDDRVLENVAMHKGIYLNEKGFSVEVPLYKVKPEDIHLYYDKGYVVMYELTQLIGEKKVNQALRALLRNHTYPKPVPVSTDLLEELYKVSPLSAHHKINELFKEVKPL